MSADPAKYASARFRYNLRVLFRGILVMNDRSRNLAYAGLIFVGFAWAIGPVTVRLLMDRYDTYTMAYVRYIPAVITLLGYSLLFHREELGDAFRKPKALIPLAVLNVAMLLSWMQACIGTTATTAQLIVKVGVIFVVVLSFILFHEERKVIKDPGYLLGTLVSFIGVTVVLTGGPGELDTKFSFATVLLFVSALLWASYAVWMKHLVTNIHPVPLFTVLVIYTFVGVAALAFTFGDDRPMTPESPRLAFLVVVSGLIPIAVSHPIYHYAQKHLGSALCSTWTLLNPFLTFLVSLVLLPNETLTPIQFFGGCVLIGGTLQVTRASIKVNARAADQGRLALNPQNLAVATADED